MNKKYTLYTNSNKDIIAVATYDGQSVRGVAKCDPRDEYNYEFGAALATARCAEKVAKRHYTKLAQELAEIDELLESVQIYRDKVANLYEKAVADLISANHTANEIYNSVN